MTHTPGSNPAFCAACGRPWPCPGSRDEPCFCATPRYLCRRFGRAVYVWQFAPDHWTHR